MTTAPFNPGPPPAPDGLRDAFRRAHRRRMRTALTSALPLVLSVGTLGVLPSGGGINSLDVTDRPPITSSPPRGAITERAPRVQASAAPLAHGTPRRPAGVYGAPSPVPTPPVPSLTPTGPPSPPADPEQGYLELSANGSASTHVVLPEEVQVIEWDASVTTSGRYAGVYVVSDDGAVRGGLIWLPSPNSSISGEGDLYPDAVGTFDVLPAGGYTVYVIGESAVTVRLGLGEGRDGLRATATTPATVWFDQRSASFGPGVIDESLRLPVPGDATSVGLGFGWLHGGANAVTSVTTCLADQAEPCSEEDRRNSGATGVNIRGAVGNGIEIVEGTLSGSLELVVEGRSAADADSALSAHYVVLDL